MSGPEGAAGRPGWRVFSKVELRLGVDFRVCPRLRCLLGRRCLPRGPSLRAVKLRLDKRTYSVVVRPTPLCKD